MILYGVPLSPFVRKVMFMLDELDVVFEQNNVPPASDDPEFRTVSPLGRIPGLADGDIKLSDSSAICHYLAMRHDSALMGGSDPVRFARIVGLDKYADEDLGPVGLQLLVERVVKPLRLKQTPDESLVEDIVAEQLPPVFDVLNRHLADQERKWFVDDTFCYADIAMAAHLGDLPLAGIELDRDRWPALGAWFERVCARPSIAKTMDSARRFADRR